MNHCDKRDTCVMSEAHNALISPMGLVPMFFGRTTKQQSLPGYAGETPPVTIGHKISASLSEIDVHSGDLQREKMTKSSKKKEDHSF